MNLFDCLMLKTNFFLFDDFFFSSYISTHIYLLTYVCLDTKIPEENCSSALRVSYPWAIPHFMVQVHSHSFRFLENCLQGKFLKSSNQLEFGFWFSLEMKSNCLHKTTCKLDFRKGMLKTLRSIPMIELQHLPPAVGEIFPPTIQKHQRLESNRRTQNQNSGGKPHSKSSRPKEKQCHGRGDVLYKKNNNRKFMQKEPYKSNKGTQVPKLRVLCIGAKVSTRGAVQSKLMLFIQRFLARLKKKNEGDQKTSEIPICPLLFLFFTTENLSYQNLWKCPQFHIAQAAFEAQFDNSEINSSSSTNRKINELLLEIFTKGLPMYLNIFCVLILAAMERKTVSVGN
ncbi:hypothetical protein VP01_1225g5 [Puccinia sorghi]|uniref:Uncharacterized protein n=1 Tax=Puccinia sorghi TaxID=27349 RepID=A0A0L6VPX4_9BASI|nr:hypothetical protein VP01_1225g5 [Puccinia sorghi]